MRLPHQPCRCDPPDPLACRQCYLAATNRAINLAWGGDGAVQEITGRPKKPCGCGGKCGDCPPPPAPPIATVLADSPSDKKLHGYAPLYAEVTRDRPVRAVCEIGVLAGDSIRAWARAWPEAEIVAADIDPAAAERIRDVPQARLVLLDVSDAAALARFGRENRNRFDLLVDDSTHKAGHQVAIRRHLRQALRPGGVMVIEDVANDAAVQALRGRVWDGRAEGRWDSRAVIVERPKQPRVLLCGQYLQRDGAPIILRNLAKHLRGWTVEVHSPLDGPLRHELEDAGIPVHVGEPTTRLAADVDLIVANTIVAAPAVALAKRLGLPCVWLIHESDPGMCGPETERRVREVIGYPARVVFPCRATAEVYRGFPGHRAEVIPTVIPPMPVRRRERTDDGWLRVVTFGRDEPRKGQVDIREAIAGLDRVALLAPHDRTDNLDVLAAADVYVCSSRLEAFPLSLQEAKAYGVPVITTPVFGAAEIIRDGIDGLHYQPGDVADLRAKLERVRTDPELRARLSRPLTHLPSYDETMRRYEALFAGAAGVSAC